MVKHDVMSQKKLGNKRNIFQPFLILQISYECQSMPFGFFALNRFSQTEVTSTSITSHNKLRNMPFLSLVWDVMEVEVTSVCVRGSIEKVGPSDPFITHIW